MKRTTLILGLSFLLSKILGLFRDTMLAAKFGALGGDGAFNLDIYYAAFRLPDLLFNLLAYGVLSAGFVPIFVEIYKKRGDKEAFTFANEILHVTLGSISFIAIIFVIIAPWIIPMFVPGFSNESLQITIKITRLMMITPIIFSIGTIVSGINNSTDKFLPLALAPISYNLGIIIGILLWAQKYGVYGVALGVVLGAILHSLVQLPSIFKSKYRYEWPKKWWTPKVKEMILISFPRIFGMSVQQIGLVISTVIASTLTLGSITIYNFAINIAALPVGLIGISTAIVSFSALSLHAAESNMQAFAKVLRQGIASILVLLIPMSIGLYILRLPIIKLLLERGKFVPADTLATGQTVSFLLFGILFEGLIFIVARGFYALKNTRIPVIAGIIAVAVHITTSYLFTIKMRWGTEGLAIAQSIAHLLNASIMTVLLSKKIGKTIINWHELIKFTISGATMAFALIFIQNILFTSSSNLFIKLPTLIVFGATIYFFSLKLLKAKTKAWTFETKTKLLP